MEREHTKVRLHRIPNRDWRSHESEPPVDTS